MGTGSNRRPRSKLELKRCRFVVWEPSAVVGLSVAGGKDEENSSKLLVLRRDGTAELYNTQNPNQWSLVSRLPGREDACASSCCILQGLGSRHVAVLASLTGTLLVWDSSTGRSKAIDSGGGPVWNVASHRSEPVFAAACDDGALRLFSVQGVVQSADGLDTSIRISVVRSLPNPSRCRALAVSWSPDCLGIAVGCSDGCVRLFRKSSTSETWLEDWRAFVSGKQGCVWAVAWTSSGQSIISGDSNGHVSLWNTQFGTQIGSVSCHLAASLALHVDSSNLVAYSASADGTVAILRITDDTIEKLGHKQGHHYDIRAIACDENAVFSGGVEGIIMSYGRGTKGFLGERQWCSIPCPQEQLFALSKRVNGDIVIANESSDRLSIEVWLVHRKDAFRNRAARVLKTSTLHMSTIALNNTAEYLAFSDRRKLRVFHIEWGNGDSETEIIKANPLTPAEDCPPLDCSHFSDEKTLIGATVDGRLLAMRLPELDSVFISDMKMSVTRLTSSHDYLAVLPCSLDVVHVFSRRLSKESGRPLQYSLSYTIPSTGGPVAAMCLHPNMPYLATTSVNGFLTIHDLQKRMPEGSASVREDLASALCLFPGGAFVDVCFRPSDTLKSQIIIGNGKFLVSLPLEVLLIPEVDDEEMKGQSGGKKQRARRRSRFKRDTSLQLPFSAVSDETLSPTHAVASKGVNSPRQSTLAQLNEHIQRVLLRATRGQSYRGSAKRATARVHLLHNPTLGMKFANENIFVILEYPWRLAVRNVEEPVARHRYGT